MDEFERDMMIMDLNEEWDELMEEINQEERKKPDWWLIALGAKDAPRASYDKCCEIYKSFKRFGAANPGKEFFELVDLFTAAMVQNRLNLRPGVRG